MSGLTIGKTFDPVTDEEALAALTEAGRILSASDVVRAVGYARGLDTRSLDRADPASTKAMRALERLATAGTIVKLDAKNGDHARHMQPGAWRDARYGWALPAAAEKARKARAAYDDAEAAKRATDDRNEDRITAALPGATQVQVYGTTHRTTWADGTPPVKVVQVKLLLTPAEFEAFAARLEVARANDGDPA